MRVRVASDRDGAGLAEIYAPIVAETAISFELDPPGPEEMSRRVGQTLPTHPWLVVDDGGLVVGYAYAHAFAARAAYGWSVETSIYVHRDRRGGGVGRVLYGALLPVLRRQGYRRAVAGATLPNPASVALHEAFGFRSVGVYRRIGWKLGAWHDVGMWQLDLDPLDDGAPERPVPFGELAADVVALMLARPAPT